VLIVATGASLLPEETEGLTGPRWQEKVRTFYTLDGPTALPGFGLPRPRWDDRASRRRLRRYRGRYGARTGSGCERSCTATAGARSRCLRRARPDTRRRTSAARRPQLPRGFPACARRRRARHGHIDRRSPQKQHPPRLAPGRRGHRRFGPGQARGPPAGGTQRRLRSPPYAHFAPLDRESPVQARPVPPGRALSRPPDERGAPLGQRNPVQRRPGGIPTPRVAAPPRPSVKDCEPPSGPTSPKSRQVASSLSTAAKPKSWSNY
jgi:hypothetical protein